MQEKDFGTSKSSLWISSLTSGFENPNPDFPIECAQRQHVTDQMQ